MSTVKPETIKALIFTIANYNLALPLKVILKISRITPQIALNFVKMGVMELDKQTIYLLNLEEVLAGVTSGELSNSAPKPFLILLYNARGQLAGIPVTDLPNTIDLALENVQPLPQSSRQSNLSAISRYVLLAPNPKEEKPIFLLDIALATQSNL